MDGYRCVAHYDVDDAAIIGFPALRGSPRVWSWQNAGRQKRNDDTPVLESACECLAAIMNQCQIRMERVRWGMPEG